jgi:hypothetical protein
MKRLLLIIALLMVGCGSTGVVRMTTADMPPEKDYLTYSHPVYLL